MIEDVLFWTFASVSTLYVLHLGFYLIGANLYDVWQYRRLHHYRSLEYSPQNRPLVTVLIPAHNEERVIERCLESIRGSTSGMPRRLPSSSRVSRWPAPRPISVPTMNGP